MRVILMSYIFLKWNVYLWVLFEINFSWSRFLCLSFFCSIVSREKRFCRVKPNPSPSFGELNRRWQSCQGTSERVLKDFLFIKIIHLYPALLLNFQTEFNWAKRKFSNVWMSESQQGFIMAELFAIAISFTTTRQCGKAKKLSSVAHFIKVEPA